MEQVGEISDMPAYPEKSEDSSGEGTEKEADETSDEPEDSNCHNEANKIGYFKDEHSGDEEDVKMGENAALNVPQKICLEDLVNFEEATTNASVKKQKDCENFEHRLR